MCVASHLCSLRCRTVTILSRLLCVFRSIRRFVIDARCAFELLMQFGQIARIAAISIAARWISRACQPATWYHVAVFICPRCTVLYVVYLRHGDMIKSIMSRRICGSVGFSRKRKPAHGSRCFNGIDSTVRLRSS